MAVSNAFGSNTFNIFVALVRPTLLLPLILGSTSDAEVSLDWHCAGGAVAGGLAARGRRHLRRAEGADLWLVPGAGMRADLLPRLRRCVTICCLSGFELLDLASLVDVLAEIFSCSSAYVWPVNWQGRTSCG